MNKPRIIILMHYLELGGAEMALIGLLDAIDKNQYDVDLFLNQHTGPLMDLIPPGVNLLPEIKEYTVLERPLSYALKRLMVGSTLRKIKRSIKFKKYLRQHNGYDSVASHFYMDYEIDSLPNLYEYGEYDLAISFLDPPHIAQDKVKAKKVIEWIHTDFAAIKYDASMTYARWAANDYIISISDDITKNFCKVFPQLRNKVKKIENIISPSFVRQRAKMEDFSKNADICIRLLSIGRINAAQKNFKIIPQIAAQLRDNGLNFVWQILGPGDPIELKSLIEQYSVTDFVKLIGPKSNPYPYIDACDIYVQPSLYEGKSIAVREAQILCKPVIITNYPSSGSQIKNGIDGIICQMDVTSIATTIKQLADNPDQRNQLSLYLKNHDYGMMDEVEKLYELI